MKNPEKRAKSIQFILEKHLSPDILKIKDQSSLHKGHNNIPEGFTETHFSIYVVSKKFVGMSNVQRHRLVNNLLLDEFSSGLHALELKLKTTED